MAAFIRAALAGLWLAMPVYAGEGSWRASEVIGRSVQTPQGGRLGQIADLNLNLKTGEVRYALLQLDNGKLYAAPTNRLTMAAGGEHLVFDMAGEQVESPAIPGSRWPGTSEALRAFSAARLIGKNVTNRQGEEIGEIRDLFIHMSMRSVRAVILAHGPGSQQPGTLAALPLGAFDLIDADEALVLDMK